MIGILKYSGIKSDTINFRKYRQVAVQKLKQELGVSNQKARTLSALLEILETYRVSFSKGDYRFQTKRVSSEVLADELGVTKRYVRILLRILETTGIITIRRRRVGRFMSLWNAFELTGFMAWLASYAQRRCTPVPPKEESNLRLLFGQITFPVADLSAGNNRHSFWRGVAREAVPIGSQLPCLAKLSIKFRLNLRKHNIGHDDPSIIARWKRFVTNAVSFQEQGKARYEV
jgi:hypothetical protein